MGPCVSVRGKEPGSARFRLAPGAQLVGEAPAPPPARGWFQSGDGLPTAGFEPNKSTPDEEAGLGFRSPRFGTKDETFFDSQEWLESDCEDDFFSVNGDVTPSRGSTPNHQMATAPIKLRQHEAALLILDGFSEAKPEPSPMKTLAELLQETMPAEPGGNGLHSTVDVKVRVNEKSGLEDQTITDQPPSSLEGTTPILLSTATNSITGERTPDGNSPRDGKEKRGKAKLCCLPAGLVHSLGSNVKKRTPTARGATVADDEMHAS